MTQKLALTNDVENYESSVANTEHIESEPTGIAAIGIDGQLLLAQIFNFVILLLLLRKFLYGPLVKLLEKRREDIATSLERSEKIAKEYEEFKVEHEKRINDSKIEAAEIIAKAKQSAKEQSDESLNKVLLETNNLLEKAKSDISREKAKSLNELKQEIGLLVVDLTSKIIGRELDSESQKRIVKEAISKVKNEE